MGWPEQDRARLKTFYPTTDLVTGPDIIFFWVARMIMAGYEFMGELPFRNVYFTGIIRDKQGRKMSKTLGNSPDPLELIAKYGADALRFGMMRSAPLGQDVLFDEKDVELGRNFCNKLWNACRFRQMQGSAEARLKARSTRRCSPATTNGFCSSWTRPSARSPPRSPSTNSATPPQTLYRFFWSEYCDWYVEASKAVLCGSAERATRSAEQDEARGEHARRDRFRPLATRCGCSIRSCRSSRRNCGTAWVTPRTCRRTRAARPSCSRRGPSRSTTISATTTASTIATSNSSTRSTNSSRQGRNLRRDRQHSAEQEGEVRLQAGQRRCSPHDAEVHQASAQRRGARRGSELPAARKARRPHSPTGRTCSCRSKA